MFLPNSNLSLPFSTWKQNFDSATYASSYAWSVANGFRVLASGDDIARRPGWEATWISSWPNSSQAVQYAMQTLTQSGAGVSLDVIDESNLFWGTNPTPVGLVGGAHSFQSVSCTGTQCAFAWPALLDPQDYMFHDSLTPGKTFVLGGSSAVATLAGRADTVVGVSGSNVMFTSPVTVPSSSPFTSANAPSLELLWFSGAVSCFATVTCNPPLSNLVLSTVADWLRTPSPAVPISWPPGGHRRSLCPGQLDETRWD